MGRHPTGKIPNQPLRIIMGKHREIMRRLVAGETQRQVAMEMGMTEARLSVICNSPLFKREYNKLQGTVENRFVEVQATLQGRINELQPKCIDVLEEILTKDKVNDVRITPLLKQNTALELLELGGNGKKAKDSGKQDAMADVVKIIAEGFNLAKEAMKERQRRDEVENPGLIRTHNHNDDIDEFIDITAKAV